MPKPCCLLILWEARAKADLRFNVLPALLATCVFSSSQVWRKSGAASLRTYGSDLPGGGSILAWRPRVRGDADALKRALHVRHQSISPDLLSHSFCFGLGNALWGKQDSFGGEAFMILSGA